MLQTLQRTCKFNRSHRRTRRVVELAISVLKHRFIPLMDGFRVHKMELVTELIKVAIILHNLAIKCNDDGSDFVLRKDRYTDDDDDPAPPPINQAE